MKTILHLCADIGSDSRPYQLDNEYQVILVGEKTGVENYEPPENVHGIIANPVCTEFSAAARDNGVWKEKRKRDPNGVGMFLVKQCMEIIEKAEPVWWVMENPSTGALCNYLGKPKAVYQPWQYGSPWTKKTALWGNFNMPEPMYTQWADVPKNESLYQRPARTKPSLAFLHKSAIDLIPEFEWAKPFIKCDADLRSLCSQGFAAAFKEANL